MSKKKIAPDCAIRFYEGDEEVVRIIRARTVSVSINDYIKQAVLENERMRNGHKNDSVMRQRYNKMLESLDM